MTAQPDLSVIVLSWNTRDLLRDCLRSVFAEAGPDFTMEVVVVDNASADGSADMVASEFPDARLVRNAANEGYARGNNIALALVAGRRICLLGSDTRIHQGALRRLAAFLDATGAGAVAPRLVNADGSVQRACMRFPTLATALCYDTPLSLLPPGRKEMDRYFMRDFDHLATRRVEQPPGTCLMLGRRAFEAVGPMDEQLWLFFNDVDWCLRLRQRGFAAWYVADAEVTHHLGRSTAQFPQFGVEWHRNRLAYYRKHYGAAGLLAVRPALAWVAIRECFRMRRHYRGKQGYASACRQVLRALWELLKPR